MNSSSDCQLGKQKKETKENGKNNRRIVDEEIDSHTQHKRND
jgi:hypothetical protein